ncbi:methyl-accepting chemotaxis protein [Pseudomonas cavernae]|uniref:Methyl-accepting chemotaxis protein n=1 Tax=Pseudomonas cavernae TaxID=2320867 RepID=A0A385Z5T5_9PSED|nr:methyl-accepting chemotaxis protein [Pseudomonas cavernae]AYC34041.1 methyl-accepting chemotaxis protein [Pseudomonas cavernae]
MFKTITIAQRLWFWALLASLLFFAAVGFGWYGLQLARDSLRTVHDEHLAALLGFGDIQKRLDDNRRLALLAFQYDPEGPLAVAHDRPVGATLDIIEANNGEIARLWGLYLQRPLGDEEKQAADAFSAHYATWLSELEMAVESLRVADFSTRYVVSFLRLGEPEGEAASEALAKLRAFQEDGIARAYQAAQQRYRLTVTVYLMLAVLGALAGSVTAYSTLRRLKMAFAIASDSLRAIARGDLSSKVAKTGNDEFGRMLADVALMRDNLHGLIAEMRQQVQRLSVEARQLAGTAAHASAAAQEQAAAVGGISSAVEQLSVSINEVEDHAGASRRITQESAGRSGESEGFISDMAEEMHGIAAAVTDTAQHVRELEAFSGDISGVLNVIKAVAEQTNLLALNAAIEAARAGEQGRGFAVVADEVRLLAQRTASSIAEISSTVTRIQEGTREVVVGMERAVTRVQGGASLAQKAGASVAQIRTGTAQVIRVVDDIGAVLKAQVEATREIAQRVEGVSTGTGELSANAGRSAAAAVDLEHLAESLKQLSERFNIGAGDSAAIS